MPRAAWTWRLLGRDPGKIPLHPVRHLSLRSAVAAGAGYADIHRAVFCLEPTQIVAPGAPGRVGRGAGRDQPSDVGWDLRIVLRAAGSLGRTAGDVDPCDLRARVRLSARDPRRARPALQIPGDPLALRALCRIDPRRSADQPVVHGERDG